MWLTGEKRIAFQVPKSREEQSIAKKFYLLIVGITTACGAEWTAALLQDSRDVLRLSIKLQSFRFV